MPARHYYLERLSENKNPSQQSRVTVLSQPAKFKKRRTENYAIPASVKRNFGVCQLAVA